MTRYHLRYQVLPGRDPGPLADFCAAHGVEEVVLMTGAEELHAGHPAGDGEDLWFETVRAARDALSARGVQVSLNPWVTVGHADRGRVQDLGFAPLVSPAGETSTAAASLACPIWRDWLAAHYGRFAGLGFRVMWLEDDFRFHNHAPLTWGGGFEPGMLARFHRLAGEEPTREELVAAITAPGEPHPWRALLQRTWREAQLEVVTLVRRAVAGRARLGLMSSGLGVASAEGRSWGALFDLVEAHRPHFAPYGDAPGRRLAYSIAMLELQRPLRPAGVEVAPEVENWTHTEWSKSDTQTWSEMVAAHLSGADALLLDVFPFVTGDPGRYPRVGRMLTRSRPALDATVTGALETFGVGVPWWEDTAAHVHGDGTLGGLAADPLRAAEFLLPYGIPVRAGVAPVTALFGATAWAVPDPAELLRGGVLLDGAAAAILTERGYGELLGVSVTEVVARETTSPRPYAVERVRDGGALLSVNVQAAVARLTAADDAEVWTDVLTPRGEHWGAGRVAHVNTLGGRVLTMAACAPELLGRCDDGRLLAQAAVRWLGGPPPIPGGPDDGPPPVAADATPDRPGGGWSSMPGGADSRSPGPPGLPGLPLVSGGPYLMPQYARVGGRWRLAVANGSADPAAPVVTGVPAGAGLRATLLEPLAEPREVTARRDGDRVLVDAGVPHRGYLIMEW
ncbi:hypothetical protein GCM10018953_24960 [Streptosporangium nondiastaticum]|uniref:hypothetical protein n=1 Tax=Streptosporangium nondiastaticum TaxID=35764 RepID=UPI0031F91C28